MISYGTTRVNKFFLEKINKEIGRMVSGANDYSSLLKYQKDVEKEFAGYTGTRHAVFCESGTKAFQASLYLCGVGKDDEVIIPAVTYPSVVYAILSRRAKPVVVDIKKDGTIDPSGVENAVSEKTKAVVPTHMFGHLCDMKEIIRICYSSNLKIIEDACQAHGSMVGSKKTGSFGEAGFFSFSPHKSIGALGGGALAFDKDEYYNEISEASDFDSGSKWINAGIGSIFMSFADTAIIKVKLKFAELIEKNNLLKRKIYDEVLSKVEGIEIIEDAKDCRSIRPSYLAYCKEKKKLAEFLSKKGISPRLPFTPLNKKEGLRDFCKGEFSNAEKYWENALLLPLFPMIRKEDVENICSCLEEFYISQN